MYMPGCFWKPLAVVSVVICIEAVVVFALMQLLVTVAMRVVVNSWVLVLLGQYHG